MRTRLLFIHLIFMSRWIRLVSEDTMRKTAFWKTDGFLGVVVSLLMLAAAGSDLVRSLERKAYDLGVQASSRTPLDRVVVIAIDDTSIANLGRWPWPRDRLAKMTDLLSEGKAKVVANTVFFFEPQIDPGYAYVTRLLELQAELPPSVASLEEIGRMGGVLEEAERALNTDRILAESMGRAGNVLLPMLFTLGESRGRPDKTLPDFVTRNRLSKVTEGAGEVWPTQAAQVPIEAQWMTTITGR